MITLGLLFICYGVGRLFGAIGDGIAKLPGKRTEVKGTLDVRTTVRKGKEGIEPKEFEDAA